MKNKILMCGIAGFVDFKKNFGENVLFKMISGLDHRGPDDRGVFISDAGNATIGLGHTRLSILDLSACGHQPYRCGNLTIVFNGEIYNFKEIKRQLIVHGYDFHSTSDTEVVIKSFHNWGLQCVDTFVGMFSFVIYDSKAHKLYLCRDRAGVKPLFCYKDEHSFLFASELKSFHNFPRFQKNIDQDAVELYLRYGYIPGEKSIFQKCFKQTPGSWQIFDVGTGKLDSVEYWNVTDYYKKPTISLSYGESKDHLKNLLISACNYRMVSDVPVGIFLSGGYDSSLVTAILQQQMATQLNTFTIGFRNGNDEIPHAKKIAEYLGTNHTDYYCTEEDVKEILLDLPFFYDEPCADNSAIPTLLVSKLAGEKVKVALSADGGDELFAGYTGYASGLTRLQKIRRLPSKKLLSPLLNAASKLYPYSRISSRRKLSGVSKILNSHESDQLPYLMDQMGSLPHEIISKVLLNRNGVFHPVYQEDFCALSDFRSAMLIIDFKGSMRDLLLVKVDRATMAASIEGREPLLDHRIVEFAAQLPFDFKYDGISKKKILKDITHDYIPFDLVNKPKTGFDMPIYSWLKRDLRFLVDDYLDKYSIQASAVFDYSTVQQLKKDFLRDRLEYFDIIWRIIHFQMWYNTWMTKN